MRCGFKASSFAEVIGNRKSWRVASIQYALKEMLLSSLPSEFELTQVFRKVSG
jgi:ATP-dependent Lhr-like helicase